MKRRLLAAILCLLAMGLSAKNSNKIYRAIYDFEYTKDSIHAYKGQDILYLELYGDHSFCFSKYTWELDSMINSPHGERLFDELLTASLLKDGVSASTYPHRRSTFMISKYPAQRSIITKDYCDNEYYQYEDSMEEFAWHITDSTKTIDGVSAVLAQCFYHGRQWEVWFCPDLPWSDGPWKFCNLPGLIIEAKDKDELFAFRLVGLKECEHPVSDWCKSVKHTQRKEFLNLRYKELKNNIIRYRTELGIDNQTTADTRYLDGLEPDFRRNAAPANYRAVYDFEYTKDSIHSITGKDVLYLEISEKSSFCFSYYSYQADSLLNAPDGRKVWRELFAAAIAKDGSNATSFPHKRSTFLITKHHQSDIVSVKDIIDNEVYQYDTNKNEFDWQLCDSTQTINGYEAYLARCHYHGREWMVWFTPDIPFSDGPWAFCGLPGLILSAQDKDGLFAFNLMGFSSRQDLKSDWTKDGKETDRVTFLKKRYQYLKNMDATLNAEMGINVSRRDDTRYLDGLEPDFK